LSSLGVWQLHRAEQRRDIIRLHETRAQLSPVQLQGNEEDPEALRYRHVHVAGQYDSAHQFLLDNQVSQGKAGYHVLTPLRIDGSGRAILVNRGWIPLTPDRTQLPSIPVEEEKVQIDALVGKFPGVGMRLAGMEVPAPGWPSRMQLFDAQQVSARLGYEVLPYPLLLAPEQPDGYGRYWQQNELDPSKNQAYALQWFSFAALALILYLMYGPKPWRSKSSKP
jgi:surfeit locus 1 family protein